MSKRAMIVYSVICVVCLAAVGGLFSRELAHRSADTKPADHSELAAVLLQAESAARACLYAGTLPSAAFECASACAKSAEARIMLARVEGAEHLDSLLKSGFALTQRLTKSLASGEGITSESADRLGKYADSLSRIRAAIASGGELPYMPIVQQNKNLPESHMLRGKREVPPGEAAAGAAAFVGLHRNSMRLEREIHGAMPVYLFSGNNGRVTVEVTKQGGFVTGMASAQASSSSDLPPEQVVNRAVSLLRSNGFTNMTMTQYQTHGGTVAVTFAYSDGGVVYYPDEICVELTRGGGMTAFSAREYIKNRRNRDFPEAAVNQTKAEKSLSTLLTVEAHKMAVIFVDSEEVYCHEFKCVTEESGETFFVYINAQSGAEEKIVRLYEAEGCLLRI
jgi:germination protein YpeB